MGKIHFKGIWGGAPSYIGRLNYTGIVILCVMDLKLYTCQNIDFFFNPLTDTFGTFKRLHIMFASDIIQKIRLYRFVHF